MLCHTSFNFGYIPIVYNHTLYKVRYNVLEYVYGDERLLIETDFNVFEHETFFAIKLSEQDDNVYKEIVEMAKRIIFKSPDLYLSIVYKPEAYNMDGKIFFEEYDWIKPIQL